MLDKVIHFVLHQRLFVVVGAVIIIVIGSIAWKDLPIDAFPDVTNVQVMILTEASGMTPVDVERQITFPIELAMQGLPDVRNIRSLSKAALSQVVVIFEDNVDTYFARQLVFERIQAAKEKLPEGTEPKMGPMSTGLGEIYQYTLQSDTHSLTELRTIQDWIIAPQLKVLPGVNEINSLGGYVKQYHVLINPRKLLQHGITLHQVLETLENNNANAGGNFIVEEWEQAYVRAVGLIQTIADIENIVVDAKDGTPLYLKDVAQVTIGRATRQGSVTRDGKGEDVAGMVIMLKDENSKIVVDRVKKAIPKIQEHLPENVHINTFYDRTTLINQCIETVSEALMHGGLFVIIILFLFLGNFRESIIVAFSLPVTALIAFILMRWQGVTANLMSLSGLAIAIGMIVDASIVVAENITRHFAEKANSSFSRTKVAYEAVREVARPIIFAVLIIVIVFIPLFTLQQMEGKMFRPLAITMCFTMIGSLLVAFTLVPVLCSHFIRPRKKHKENLLHRTLKRIYWPVLELALRKRWTTALLTISICIGVFLFIPFVGTEFLPQLDEGAIVINIVKLPSASLEGSIAVGTEIERRVLSKFPEVETVVTKTGSAEISEDPMGPEQSDVFIMLHPKAAWKTGRTKKELVAAIQKELSVIPGLTFSFSQPIALRVNEIISGIKSDLALKIFGDDLDILRENANRISAILNGIEGAEDVKVEQISGFSQIEIVIDRNAIARHKINVADINDVIEIAVGGKVATTVVENQKRFAVLVRFPERHRSDIASLNRILIPAPDGHSVPLELLAKIKEVEAPAQVSRENGMRRAVVECNIRGRDMGGFVAEVKKKIKSVTNKLPTGYFVDFSGQFENQQRAMKRLAIVVPVAILLIFLMLFSAFDSLRNALVVMITLPFALVGGILALMVFRINLSVPSAIGFIALFGVAVEDGIVLITFFNQLRQKGLDVVSAVKKGCELRFRPVVMTSLTTLLGILPLMYATGSGSEIQKPLAAVVLGGLISALVLTLIVLPVLYCLVESTKTNTR